MAMAGNNKRPSPRQGKENTPDTWFDGDVRRIAGGDLYYFFPPGETNPWVWHWCTRNERWHAQGTANHALVSREPLHLEPSLLWECCGKHGFVRVGVWTSA